MVTLVASNRIKKSTGGGSNRKVTFECAVQECASDNTILLPCAGMLGFRNIVCSGANSISFY